MDPSGFEEDVAVTAPTRIRPWSCSYAAWYQLEVMVVTGGQDEGFGPGETSGNHDPRKRPPAFGANPPTAAGTRARPPFSPVAPVAAAPVASEGRR
jgi:hypothetical protein